MNPKLRHHLIARLLASKLTQHKNSRRIEKINNTFYIHLPIKTSQSTGDLKFFWPINVCLECGQVYSSLVCGRPVAATCTICCENSTYYQNEENRAAAINFQLAKLPIKDSEAICKVFLNHY